MRDHLLSLGRRAASTLTKEAGDISSVFPSLSGKKPDPLPPRYSELKKLLIRGNEEAVIASWHRLLKDLKKEIGEIRAKGSDVGREPSNLCVTGPNADLCTMYRSYPA